MSVSVPKPIRTMLSLLVLVALIASGNGWHAFWFFVGVSIWTTEVKLHREAR